MFAFARFTLLAQIDRNSVQSSLVVPESMFSWSESSNKRSLQSKCKAGDCSPVLRFGTIAVSTDQPLLSYMQFVVAALLCLVTGLMTDRVSIVFFSVRYSSVLDLSSSAK